MPGKLAWGMIAFQHAAVLDAGGHLDKMDGVYISWANQYHLRVIIIIMIRNSGLTEICLRFEKRC